MKWFHAWDTMDWPRISVIVASATAFWIGLATILPEKHYRIGTTILGALQSAITLTMRSGKSRGEKIGEKIAELETKGDETREEIQTLIVKEAEEQAAKKEE